MYLLAMIYFAKLKNGYIKIGYTRYLCRRKEEINGYFFYFCDGSSLLERAIHRSLDKLMAPTNGRETFYDHRGVHEVIDLLKNNIHLGDYKIIDLLNKRNEFTRRLDPIALKAELKKKKKTQVWLAKKFGVTRQYIHILINEKNVKHVDKIANLLNIDAEKLIEK